MLYNPALIGAASASYVFQDSDAENYHDRLILAGETIAVGQPALIDTLFQTLKAGSNMPTEQFLLFVGVDTVAGAMTPVMQSMPSPTNNGFVNSDVSRLTGLTGSGTQYIDSGTLVNDAPQNDVSAGVYIRTTSGYQTSLQAVLGGGIANAGTLSLLTKPGIAVARVQSQTFAEIPFTLANDTAIGVTRNNANNYQYFFGSTTGTQTNTSQTPINAKMYFFARADSNGTATSLSTGTIAAAWHSEALSIASLDSAIKAYIDGLALL